jgi:hypothetical protein
MVKSLSRRFSRKSSKSSFRKKSRRNTQRNTQRNSRKLRKRNSRKVSRKKKRNMRKTMKGGVWGSSTLKSLKVRYMDKDSVQMDDTETECDKANVGLIGKFKGDPINATDSKRVKKTLGEEGTLATNAKVECKKTRKGKYRWHPTNDIRYKDLEKAILNLIKKCTERFSKQDVVNHKTPDHTKGEGGRGGIFRHAANRADMKASYTGIEFTAEGLNDLADKLHMPTEVEVISPERTSQMTQYSALFTYLFKYIARVPIPVDYIWSGSIDKSASPYYKFCCINNYQYELFKHEIGLDIEELKKMEEANAAAAARGFFDLEPIIAKVVTKIRTIINEHFSEQQTGVLKLVFLMLNKISLNSGINKMPAYNLALTPVMPSLLPNLDQYEMGPDGKIIGFPLKTIPNKFLHNFSEFLIVNATVIFKEELLFDSTFTREEAEELLGKYMIWNDTYENGTCPGAFLLRNKTKEMVLSVVHKKIDSSLTYHHLNIRQSNNGWHWGSAIDVLDGPAYKTPEALSVYLLENGIPIQNSGPDNPETDSTDSLFRIWTRTDSTYIKFSKQLKPSNYVDGELRVDDESDPPAPPKNTPGGIARGARKGSVYDGFGKDLPSGGITRNDRQQSILDGFKGIVTPDTDAAPSDSYKSNKPQRPKAPKPRNLPKVTGAAPSDLDESNKPQRPKAPNPPNLSGVNDTATSNFDSDFGDNLDGTQSQTPNDLESMDAVNSFLAGVKGSESDNELSSQQTSKTDTVFKIERKEAVELLTNYMDKRNEICNKEGCPGVFLLQRKSEKDMVVLGQYKKTDKSLNFFHKIINRNWGGAGKWVLWPDIGALDEQEFQEFQTPEELGEYLVKNGISIGNSDTDITHINFITQLTPSNPLGVVDYDAPALPKNPSIGITPAGRKPSLYLGFAHGNSDDVEA